MPLYRYRCNAGHSAEKLYKYSDRPVEVACPTCGQRSCLDVAASFRPAKTAGKWGESAGRYDRGLGCYVQNSKHRDQVMAAKGLVSESDLPPGTADDMAQDAINEHVAHERTMARLRANISEHKDLGTAYAETFPVDLDTLDLSGE